MRTIALPCVVEKDKAVAEYEDGMLIIRLPRKKSAQLSKLKVTPIKNLLAKLRAVSFAKVERRDNS